MKPTKHIMKKYMINVGILTSLCQYNTMFIYMNSRL